MVRKLLQVMKTKQLESGISRRRIKRMLTVLKNHEGSVYSVAISPEGKRIVSGSQDRTIRVWDI